MKVLKTAARLTAVISFLVILSSCSYGFFNLFSDTGRIELEFEFTNVNALNVDRLVYELTPPEGSPFTVELRYYDRFKYFSLDNADAGAWSIRVAMYSGDEFISEYSYPEPLTVVKELTTKLRLQANYISGYDIVPEVTQYDETDQSAGSTGEYFPPEPNFSISGMALLQPSFFRDHRRGYERAAAEVRVNGGGFALNIGQFSLTYPDGSVFEYENSRILDSCFINDSIIEFYHNFTGETVLLNGLYSLELTDYNSAVSHFEKDLVFDYESLIPKVTSTDIPDTFTISDSYEFFFETSTSTDIGTRLVFFVNTHTNEIYPANNTIAVGGGAGSRWKTPSSIFEGNWELIAAVIGHFTTTPYDEAAGSSLSLDYDSEHFAESMFSLYGEDTGFVVFTAIDLVVK